MRSPKGSERTLLTLVQPGYPPTPLEHEIGGTVRLQVMISAKGNVGSVNLLGGSPVLAQAATEAVEKWKYAAGSASTSNGDQHPVRPPAVNQHRGPGCLGSACVVTRLQVGALPDMLFADVHDCRVRPEFL